MNAQLLPIALYSQELDDLALLFRQLEAPYQEADIRGFNHLYRKIYKGLSVEERQIAERMVDLLLKDLAHPGLARLIYGVV